MSMNKVHPMYFLCEIVENNVEILSLHFRRYTYIADSNGGTCEEFVVSRANFHLEALNQMIDHTSADQDLAISSSIQVKGNRIAHIPMIDFQCSVRNIPEALQSLRKHITPEIFNSLTLYASGNSVHGYSSVLISEEELSIFLGQLLCSNIDQDGGFVHYIDTRWIGHRLQGHFCSLRLSCNQKKYLKIPMLLGMAVEYI